MKTIIRNYGGFALYKDGKRSKYQLGIKWVVAICAFGYKVYADSSTHQKVEWDFYFT